MLSGGVKISERDDSDEVVVCDHNASGEKTLAIISLDLKYFYCACIKTHYVLTKMLVYNDTDTHKMGVGHEGTTKHSVLDALVKRQGCVNSEVRNNYYFTGS